MEEKILFFRHAQALHGRMLTTVIFSPLHLRRPASHSVIVWETEASPTRTHTLNPGPTHSVSSLQRHTLVWSIKRGQLKTVWDYKCSKVYICFIYQMICHWIHLYHCRSATTGTYCRVLIHGLATRSCCPLPTSCSFPYIEQHASCTRWLGLSALS